jgi:hypothetical protein
VVRKGVSSNLTVVNSFLPILPQLPGGEHKGWYAHHGRVTFWTRQWAKRIALLCLGNTMAVLDRESPTQTRIVRHPSWAESYHSFVLKTHPQPHGYQCSIRVLLKPRPPLPKPEPGLIQPVYPNHEPPRLQAKQSHRSPSSLLQPWTLPPTRPRLKRHRPRRHILQPLHDRPNCLGLRLGR